MSSEKSAQENENKSAKKGHVGWWFLLLVVAIYLITWNYSADFASASLKHFQHLLTSIAPVLGMVFIILWVLNLSKGMQDKLAHLADENSGTKGWLVAVLGGILSHGPVYAWYPLLQKLESQGGRPALIASFLYARAIKLPYLPLMVHYFGMLYTVLVTFYIALFSVLHGWMVEKMMHRSSSAQE